LESTNILFPIVTDSLLAETKIVGDAYFLGSSFEQVEHLPAKSSRILTHHDFLSVEPSSQFHQAGSEKTGHHFMLGKRGWSHGKNRRRYSTEEKAAAIRMVRVLMTKLRTDRWTAQRVLNQLGYGPESVQTWVRQADIDAGVKTGMASCGLSGI